MQWFCSGIGFEKDLKLSISAPAERHAFPLPVDNPYLSNNAKLPKLFGVKVFLQFSGIFNFTNAFDEWKTWKLFKFPVVEID